ncbi:hypothetical protein TCAP_07095 [Tolypocladium capitatum]|uniref:Uncharacterized protein n=1 Tax=Tolypocladium capitatum TaxID=45235 RepID=A0A2K3Q508_9HYPO|nr:hypothetical protein TCAP_07095 [Tolypocladium capitatum]
MALPFPRLHHRPMGAAPPRGMGGWLLGRLPAAAAALPRVLLRGRRQVVPALLAARPAALLGAAGAAGDEDDDGRGEGEDGGDDHQPDGRPPLGPAAPAAVAVDVVPDDAEGDEVADHGDDGEDKGQQRGKGGQQRADDARGQAEHEGDEAERRRHGVQHHGAGEAGRGVLGGRGEVGAVDPGHDLRRVVADVPGRALVAATANRACEPTACAALVKRCAASELTGGRGGTSPTSRMSPVTRGRRCRG